jgi:hypothetical protein
LQILEVALILDGKLYMGTKRAATKSNIANDCALIHVFNNSPRVRGR